MILHKDVSAKNLDHANSGLWDFDYINDRFRWVPRPPRFRLGVVEIILLVLLAILFLLIPACNIPSPIAPTDVFSISEADSMRLVFYLEGR